MKNYCVPDIHSVLCLYAQPRVLVLVERDEERRVVLDGEGEAAAVQEELLDDVAPLSVAL